MRRNYGQFETQLRSIYPQSDVKWNNNYTPTQINGWIWRNSARWSNL